MTKVKLVSIQAVTDSTPLDQTYVVAMQTDSASETIANIQGSVFSRQKREARDIYEAMVKKLGSVIAGTPGDQRDGARALIIGEDDKHRRLMCAEFRANMEAAASAYDGKPVDPKAKGTWNQNKGDLGRALLLGMDFIENGEIAKGKMTKWCKTTEDDAEDAKNAEALAEGKAKAEAEGGSHVNGVDSGTNISTTETKTTDIENAGGNTAGAGDETAVNHAAGIIFASDADKKAFDSLLELMAGISQNDPKELTKFLSGSVNQLSQKSEKLLRLAAAS